MQRAHLFGRAFRRGHGGGSAECTQEERRPLMARTNGREQKAGQHADAKAKGSLSLFTSNSTVQEENFSSHQNTGTCLEY
jgi:hypothetical protein